MHVPQTTAAKTSPVSALALLAALTLQALLALPACGGPVGIGGNGLPKFPAGVHDLTAIWDGPAVVSLTSEHDGGPVILPGATSKVSATFATNDLRNSYGQLWAQRYTIQYEWDFGGGTQQRFYPAAAATAVDVTLGTAIGNYTLLLTAILTDKLPSGSTQVAQVFRQTYEVPYTVGTSDHAPAAWSVAIDAPATVLNGEADTLSEVVQGKAPLDTARVFEWRFTNHDPNVTLPLTDITFSSDKAPKITFTNKTNADQQVDITLTVHNSLNTADQQTAPPVTVTVRRAAWDIANLVGPQALDSGQSGNYSALLRGTPPPDAERTYEWTFKAYASQNNTGATLAGVVDKAYISGPGGAAPSAATAAVTFTNIGNGDVDVFVEARLTVQRNVGDPANAASFPSATDPPFWITVHPAAWGIAVYKLPTDVKSGEVAPLEIVLRGTVPPNLTYFWQFGPGANTSTSPERIPNIKFTNPSKTDSLTCAVNLLIYNTDNPTDQVRAQQQSIKIAPQPASP